MTGPGDGGSAALPGVGADGQEQRCPHVAQIYDVLLGGTCHGAAELRAAETVLAHMPALAGVVRADRAFLGRAVRHLLAAEIHQFVDLGSGLPASGCVHEVVAGRDPAARVVYVDVDPLVVELGTAMVAAVPGAVMLRADLREPQRILTDPEVLRILDPRLPVGLLMVGSLHLLADDQAPAGVVDAWFDAVAPGSFLAMSHMGLVERQTPRGMGVAAALYSRSGGALHPRSRETIEALFGRWQIQPPGLVAVPLWRPEPDAAPLPAGVTFPGVAALAGKPVPPRSAPGQRADAPATTRRVPRPRAGTW